MVILRIGRNFHLCNFFHCKSGMEVCDIFLEQLQCIGFTCVYRDINEIIQIPAPHAQIGQIRLCPGLLLSGYPQCQHRHMFRTVFLCQLLGFLIQSIQNIRNRPGIFDFIRTVPCHISIVHHHHPGYPVSVGPCKGSRCIRLLIFLRESYCRSILCQFLRIAGHIILPPEGLAVFQDKGYCVSPLLRSGLQPAAVSLHGFRTNGSGLIHGIQSLLGFQQAAIPVINVIFFVFFLHADQIIIQIVQ